jgi:hypothetical protein
MQRIAKWRFHSRSFLFSLSKIRSSSISNLFSSQSHNVYQEHGNRHQGNAHRTTPTLITLLLTLHQRQRPHLPNLQLSFSVRRAVPSCQSYYLQLKFPAPLHHLPHDMIADTCSINSAVLSPHHANLTHLPVS